MNISTLLNILSANGHDNLIALACKIDNNIEQVIPTALVVNMRESDLPAGMKFVGENKGYRDCYALAPVVTHNMYKVSDNFLVTMPNGTVKWVSDNKWSYAATALEPIQAPVAALEVATL
jgi:hypothetical protein